MKKTNNEIEISVNSKENKKEVSVVSNTLNFHAGHRERLRNSIENVGIENMQEHQIVEFLLTHCVPRKDTNKLAHILIKEFGSIENILDADIEFLKGIKGIGAASALFLNSIGKISREYLHQKTLPKTKLNTHSLLIPYLLALLQFSKIEKVYVLLLDNSFELLHKVKLSEGLSNISSINTFEIVKLAVKHNASSVIICHNHPNTEPRPSFEDTIVTTECFNQLATLNISLSDHIIVNTKGEFYSFASNGFILKLKNKLEETRKNDKNFVALMANKTDIICDLDGIKD